MSTCSVSNGSVRCRCSTRAHVRQQVQNGSLVIRRMTEEERRRYSPCALLGQTGPGGDDAG
jgi:hypothetical protein